MRRRTFPNFIGDFVNLEERLNRTESVMRIIGFTPDKPYTLNVNDGTRNRVEIGKIDSDYGIRIIDNAGNEILLANGTIVADAIKTGTLDCNLITVSNLSASVIVTGELSATRISGGTLNCSLMTVTNLNAGSITVGTFSNPNDRFTTGSLSGVKISDGTITGNKLVAYTIQADNIATNAISADKITAGAVSADKIATGAVTATKINVSYLSAISSNIGSITAGTINADTVNVQNLNASNFNRGIFQVGYAGKPTAMYIARGAIGDAKFYFEGGSRMWSDSSNRIGINSLGSPMYIYVDSQERLIIPSSGQVTARGGLYADGNCNVVDTLRVHNGGFQVDGKFNTTTSDKLRLYINLDMGDNNIDGAWTVWAYNFSNRSDKSLKKNIKNTKYGINAIMDLRPVDFIYKKKDKNYHSGLIAQEVEKVLPELVDKDDNGLMGIRYNEIIPILIKAIQDLKTEINSLKEGKK